MVNDNKAESKDKGKGPKIVAVKKREIKEKKPPRKVIVYYDPEDRESEEKIKKVLLEFREERK